MRVSDVVRNTIVTQQPESNGSSTYDMYTSILYDVAGSLVTVCFYIFSPPEEVE